jgi:hypothetical protein
MPAGFTDFQPVGDISSLGTTVLTKLAQSFEQFSSDDLSRFFPTETTMNTSITIERVKEGVGVAPLVRPGFTDVLTDNAQVERSQAFPAYSRESDFIPQNIINDLRKVGTLNEKEGKEFVARRIQRMTNRSNHLYNVFKALLLQGQISYTDPRTGEGINVNANIPAGNMLDVVASFGGAQGWSAQATASPIKQLIEFRKKIHNRSKVMPKYIIMTSDLQTILENNAEILRRSEQAFNPLNVVQFTDGRLTKIAGMQVITVDHIYQPPGGGTPVKVWGINKVCLISDIHPDYPGTSIGRMMYCVGEDPMGRPGIWVRSGPDTTPPAAPGRSMQMGNSGLPYLIYPDWIGLMTVDTVNNLSAIVDPTVTNTF